MASVNFFPKGNIPVEVCPVRYGKSMLYSECTDTIATNAVFGELCMFKYNIKATAFFNNYNSANNSLAGNFHKSGRVDLGVYFPTDRWFKDGLVALIPDYTATAWTSAGATAFANAVQGQSKPARYPNHGQELYDISGGVYGYDTINGVSGSNLLDEFNGLCSLVIDHYNSITGFNPSFFSYRNGQNVSPIVYMPYFLGARNSDFSTEGDANTFYGDVGFPNEVIDRAKMVNRPSTTRWWDFWHALGSGTKQESIDYSVQEFEKTAVNNGWFNNFIHWHTASTSDLEEYFTMMGVLADEYEVHRSSYLEAIEYLWFKECIKRVTAKEVSGNIEVYIEMRDIMKGGNISGIPTDIITELIRTPISLKINLDGTVLSGADIDCSTGYCLKNNNEIIFEVPLSNYKEGFLKVVLKPTNSPDYINFDKPTISYHPSEDGLTIETDQETKIVLYGSSSGSEYDAIDLYRSESFETIHVSDAQDVKFIGAINRFGASNLISI